MAIKTFRPKTHSLRFKTVIDYKQDLTTDEPYKPLLESQESDQRPQQLWAD